MKTCLRFLKKYIPQCILAPLFKMLEASFELLVPLVMKVIIDRGIDGSNTALIYKMGAVLVLLAIVGYGTSITAQYFSAKAAVGMSKELRAAVFKKIQTFSFSQVDTIGSSTLMNRISGDVNQVQSGVNMTLRLLLRSPFVVFGAMVMAFYVNAREALTFVVVIPLLFIIVFFILLSTMPMYRKVQEKNDKIFAHTRENLKGIRVIRAFRREQKETEDFDASVSEYTGLSLAVGRIANLLSPITFIIVNAATLIIIYSGAQKVDAGLLTRGEVLALVNYMSQILVELVKFANLVILAAKALACSKRIAQILEMDEEDNTFSEAEDMALSKDGEYILEFRNVDLTYRGAGKETLSDISFKMKRGETIGIIGSTGSGKSSLVNLIPRFYERTAGEIYFDGELLEHYSKKSLRSRIAVVMQKSLLTKGTVLGNLLWGKRDADSEEAVTALKRAQAYEFISTREGGISASVEQEGRNFSGGQKQRLSIARALIRNAELLILDDSSSALDYATDAALKKALKELNPKPSIIVVSQRTASIAHADRILVMENGRIAAEGTHAELLETSEIYREIYKSQYQKEARS